MKQFLWKECNSIGILKINWQLKKRNQNHISFWKRKPTKTYLHKGGSNQAPGHG